LTSRQSAHVDADRANRLAQVVERLGADLTLSQTTRDARLRRVEDALLRERSERSLTAASRELRRWRDEAVADGPAAAVADGSS
jgi:hypothetical protein